VDVLSQVVAVMVVISLVMVSPRDLDEDVGEGDEEVG
jgi:hypothetical protein